MRAQLKAAIAVVMIALAISGGFVLAQSPQRLPATSFEYRNGGGYAPYQPGQPVILQRPPRHTYANDPAAGSSSYPVPLSSYPPGTVIVQPPGASLPAPAPAANYPPTVDAFRLSVINDNLRMIALLSTPQEMNEVNAALRTAGDQYAFTRSILEGLIQRRVTVSPGG